MQNNSFEKAFSLIEVLIAISILAIVSVLSLSTLGAIQKNSRDTQREGDLRSLQSALQQFYADQNFYPNSLTLTGGAAFTNCTGSASCTVSRTYISASPKDPTGALPYCYTSQKSATDATSCASANPGQCNFYRLNAKYENPPSGAGSFTCASSGVAGYNMELTPL